MIKQKCNNLYVLILGKMARSLNSHCDFKEGFFTCDLPCQCCRVGSQGEDQTRQTYTERGTGIEGWRNTDHGETY